jgi:membrane-associated phospholipid phosphatase
MACRGQSSCHQKFCVSIENDASASKVCPYGHCRQWIWVVIAITFPGILLFILNLLKYDLQSLPTRSVTTSDQRFWKSSEIPEESISTVMLFVYALLIPSIFVIIGILGAWKKDLELRNRSNQVKGTPPVKITNMTKDIPFRGWALGIYCLVNWADLLVTVILKYYNHQMRPKSLAECYHVLHKQQYNMSSYVGTLEQLKLCCKHDPNLFQGYPSGHSSMAFCGLFGFGILISSTDWLLEGLAHVLCCCRDSPDEEISDPIHRSLKASSLGSKDNDALESGGSGKNATNNTKTKVAGELLNREEGVGDCLECIGDPAFHVIKGVILLLCGIFAALIACTRVNDGSHFPYQVNAGSLLGLIGAACFTSSGLLLKDVELGGSHREGTKVVTTAKTRRTINSIDSIDSHDTSTLANKISEHINVELGAAASLSPKSRARKRNTVH